MTNFKKIKGNLINKSSIINWDKVKIGKGNIIGPNVIIGTEAQHPYEKSDGKIVIGNNVFREFTTITSYNYKKNNKIGNKCYFMAVAI